MCACIWALLYIKTGLQFTSEDETNNSQPVVCGRYFPNNPDFNVTTKPTVSIV